MGSIEMLLQSCCCSKNKILASLITNVIGSFWIQIFINKKQTKTLNKIHILFDL